MKSYGILTRLLTELLKKDKFAWYKLAYEAFEQLKLAMIFVLVLALLDFEEVFVVEVDASISGLGAVLIQNHRSLLILAFH